MMTNMEFYTTPSGDVTIEGESGPKLLDEKDRKFVSAFLAKIQDLWPWSLQPLFKKFEKLKFNVPLYEFRVIKHWIKCNLGNYDSVLDIDQLGNLHLEIVVCPLRGGDCLMEGDHNTENRVCKPKFNSKLSDRELEVMKLLYENNSMEQISDTLYISTETAKTHKRNAFRRINVHSLPEFFTYARNNKLFEN